MEAEGGKRRGPAREWDRTLKNKWETKPKGTSEWRWYKETHYSVYSTKNSTSKSKACVDQRCTSVGKVLAAIQS